MTVKVKMNNKLAVYFSLYACMTLLFKRLLLACSTLRGVISNEDTKCFATVLHRCQSNDYVEKILNLEIEKNSVIRRRVLWIKVESEYYISTAEHVLVDDAKDFNFQA